jgi:hypothetical protein
MAAAAATAAAAAGGLLRYVVERTPIVCVNARAALSELEESRRQIISPTQLNATIKRELTLRGWQSEYPLQNQGKMAVDFYKAGVLVEIQLGHNVYGGENVHAKFPLALKEAREERQEVHCCVLVTPSYRIHNKMSNGVCSYEGTLRNYVEPLLSRIDYNLLVLGL